MLKLLSAEMWHRKMQVLLSLCAVIAAATLFVAGPTIMDGYQNEMNAYQAVSAERLAAMQRETDEQLGSMRDKAKQDLAHLDKRTKRIMRDLGFNLRIIHRDTDLTQLYANFKAFDMPESYVQKLADSPEVTKIVHLVATLKQMIQWQDDVPRVVVGFAPEATQSHIEQKAPMGFQIKPGTVYLGSEAAKGFKLGDEIEVLGHKFQVARILEPHGRPDEDIAIAMHLKDAQKVLDKPGKISEIIALGCKCKTVDRVEEITAQLEAVLPEAKVMEHRLNAIARDEQRKLVTRHNQQLMEDYQARREAIQSREREDIERERADQLQLLNSLGNVNSTLTPLVVLVCAIWVGMLAWVNVRERRCEIGLLRAIGKGSLSIASLFLGKALLVGLAGGVVGCLAGSALAGWLARDVLHVGAEHFAPSWVAIVATICGAPLVAVMSSYLPTLRALTQDPAVVLMEE